MKREEKRTHNSGLAKVAVQLRTLAVNLLKRLKPKNMAAQIDEFSGNFNILIQFMTQQMVLEGSPE